MKPKSKSRSKSPQLRLAEVTLLNASSTLPVPSPISHTLKRRTFITSGAALALGMHPSTSLLAFAADGSDPHAQHKADALKVLLQENAQAIMELAQRLIDCFAKLGEPFPAEILTKIKDTQESGQLQGATMQALELLQSRVLLTASITPEARISAKRTSDGVALIQGGWRLFLVKIENPAIVPGRFNLTSPNALPVNGVFPPGHPAAQALGGGGAPTTRGDIAQRWLELDVYDEAPLDANLERLPLDYKILRLYARDAGIRSARLLVDLGGGVGDLGDRNQVSVNFKIAPARTIRLMIRDADGSPVTASLLITDTQGRVVPAQTKRSPPDMFFQKKIYRRDGQSLSLPDGKYQVICGRGPEYLLQTTSQQIDKNNLTWSFQLERWIHPEKHGWYSGDHHVHGAGCAHYEQPEAGVGPEMLMPQVEGEALSIASVLTWGPGFYTQKLNFSGKDDPVSSKTALLHYDLEVSGFPSSHCGHLALLQMKEMDFPGAQKIEQWPSSNAPVLRWAKQQGAVTGYAHSGVGLWAGTTDLPNAKIPPFNGIGANDYIVTLPAGLVDFISTCNHPPAAEMNIWYHTLNVGLRSRIAGETDWPCFYEESIGMGRSYVQLEGKLNYADWCQGLKAGRSYVSEGRTHLMNFSAHAGQQSTNVGGADLTLSTPTKVSFELDFAARLEPKVSQATEAIRKLAPLDKPYWHIERARVGNTRQVIVELLVNGIPVEARSLLADGALRALRFETLIRHSCWVALRVANSAHTNPIWINVGATKLRVKSSATWCRASVDQCWSQKAPRLREQERPAEALLYDQARQYYDRALAEAEL